MRSPKRSRRPAITSWATRQEGQLKLPYSTGVIGAPGSPSACSGRLSAAGSSLPLSMDQRAGDHGRVEKDPADAREVDVLVPLVHAVREPQERGEQVSAPGQHGDAGG